MTASPLPDGSAPHRLRVVVSGAATTLAGAFAQAVLASGHDLRQCESIAELLRVVLSQELDVVVAYLDDPIEALALSRWFAGRRPSTRLVFACGPDSKVAVAPLEAVNAAVTIWAGASQQEQLDELVRMPKRAGLVGRFLEIELVDYVQIVGNNAISKLIRVESDQGSGYIWFDRGKIVHAEFGALDAEPAFYALVSGNNGSFCEVAYQAPSRVSIEASNTHLLMEASRLKDEAQTESGFLGEHALDDELYGPIVRLESMISHQPSGSFDDSNDDFILDGLESANDIEMINDVDIESEDEDELGYLEWCGRQEGVVQVDSIALTEDISKEFEQELRDWGRRVLFVLQCRVSTPISVVSVRQGQEHYIGVVYRDMLVVAAVSLEHDAFEVRDKLLEKAGQS